MAPRNDGMVTACLGLDTSNAIHRCQWLYAKLRLMIRPASSASVLSAAQLNPRTGHVPPAPQAPPAPRRFIRYDTKSNQYAVIVGMIGLGIGGIMIWGARPPHHSTERCQHCLSATAAFPPLPRWHRCSAARAEQAAQVALGQLAMCAEAIVPRRRSLISLSLQLSL